jgi:signal transduction histidine kinase
MKQPPSLAGDIVHLRLKQEVLFTVSNFIGILIFSYYGFVHWHAGQTAATVVNFAYAGLAVLVLLWVNVGGKVDLAQNVVLASLIPLFCLMMIEGNPRSEGTVWITMYPLLAFFYKGKHSGMKWLAWLIGALLFVLFLKTFYYVRSPFPVSAFLILIAGLVTAAMYVYAYDAIRSEAEQTLRAHTLALDDANRKLMEEIAERQRAQQKLLARTRELSELNCELSDTVEKLARLNAEKNELMNMIAHDLRNPLTGVLLTAKQLERQENLEAPDNHRRIGEVKRSIQYTLRLINNFLGLKAMEAGHTALDIRRHDLATLVAQVADRFRSYATVKNIELHYRAHTVAALCDREAMLEIAENLISNAVKFSPPATRIDVTVSREGEKAVVKVSDQGPGLSNEDKRKLFKMFTRLSARPTGGEESIGLGLSTAKKLTELMGGGIACESECGHGATFMVELPAAPAEAGHEDPILESESA